MNGGIDIFIELLKFQQRETIESLKYVSKLHFTVIDRCDEQEILPKGKIARFYFSSAYNLRLITLEPFESDGFKISMDGKPKDFIYIQIDDHWKMRNVVYHGFITNFRVNYYSFLTLGDMYVCYTKVYILTVLVVMTIW